MPPLIYIIHTFIPNFLHQQFLLNSLLTMAKTYISTHTFFIQRLAILPQQYNQIVKIFRYLKEKDFAYDENYSV